MEARKQLQDALIGIFADAGLDVPAKLTIEAPKRADHGDLATNAAMLLASATHENPRQIAGKIAATLRERCPLIERVEVAGPGFCNIYFQRAVWTQIINKIERDAGAYGCSDAGKGRQVLVEYVSANPTGPLHVGHGRGAALGDSVARLLRAGGYKVSTEYYLNDAGRQMGILGQSIWARVLQLAGREEEFPEDGYKGEYIRELAASLLKERPDLPDLPEEEGRDLCRQYGMKEILRNIKEDLARFRCEHQEFASEAALSEKGSVEKALHYLMERGRAYEKDGATWLKTSDHNDDHDRVLRKSDGSLTYFASDIAYHEDKFTRGYDWLIDVWGADHHGYIPRMRAAISEMGRDPQHFSVMLVQLVNWLRDGQKVSMSTRGGEFVTLARIIEEVGADAARFLFLSRSCDSPLDFDLELVKRRTLDNPVYYVQYAHARVHALLRRGRERGIFLDEITPPEILDLLDKPAELAIARSLSEFEDTVYEAGRDLAPHYITRYLTALATLLHGYYAHQKILVPEDPAVSVARLALSRACMRTIKNGLFLLGVSAPDSM